MKKEYKYMVCVHCWTYNHAPYIEDTLNGFCMQETSFPYVCAIVDDDSTDGEQEVIKNYLQEHFDLEDSIVRNEENNDYILSFARHKTNHNCYFAVLYLKYNHYSIKKSKVPYIKEWGDNSKYSACCEGDDYWIAPNKLQIQVDFLESHPNINMCTHACQVVWGDKRIISVMKKKGGNQILDTGGLIEGVGAGKTVTLVYRHSIYENRPSFWTNLDVGDYPLCVFYAINGGIYYIDKVMSTYRRFSSNSWTSRVQKDCNLFMAHVEKMIIWAKEFDKYTNYRFHDNVQSRIDYCMFLIYLRQSNWREIYRSRFFKSHKKKKICALVMRGKCPKVLYVWKKLSKIFANKG